MSMPYATKNGYKTAENKILMKMKSFFILFVLEGTFGWRIGTPQVFQISFLKSTSLIYSAFRFATYTHHALPLKNAYQPRYNLS